MSSTLTEKIQFLFDCDYFSDDFDPDGNEVHQDMAENLLKENAWKDIFNEVYRFMVKHCTTAKEMFNFCNLYCIYLFDEQPIDIPYEFVARVLHFSDLDKNWDSYGDFIDSFTVNILKNSGKVDLMKSPTYRAWEDPHVLSEMEKIRS